MIGMRTNSGFSMKLAVVLGLLSGASCGLADLPKALDLVPGDSPIVLSVRNVGKFKDRVQGLMETLKVPQDELDGFGDLEEAMALPGIHRGGSMAMVIYPPEKIANPEEDGMVEDKARASVILIPVTDYAAFVTAGGGDPNAATSEITFGDFTSQIRKAGDSFAVICDDAEDLAKFVPGSGQIASHTNTLGTVGMRVAESSDAFVYANMAPLRPLLEAGIAEGRQAMKEQAENPEMAEMMAGGIDVVKAMGTMFDIGDTLVRDAQAAVFGMKLTDTAGAMDLGIQFTTGSETAGFFNSAGDSSSLLGMLPNQPFVAAYSMDMHDANLKRAMTKWLEFSRQFQGEVSALSFGFGPEIIALADGQAATLGTVDLSNGLFSKWSQIYVSKDPKALRSAFMNVAKQMDGATQQGMTFRTTYSAETKEIAGRMADVWTMGMDVDPESEMAMAMQMVGPMLFGPEGQMKGYAATFKKGLAFTMSPNTPLLTATIEAAEGGPGLGLNADVAKVAEMLPKGRTMEMYLGTREITQSIHDAMMAFMGEAPFEVPEKLSPVGFGATTNDGGMHMRIVLPSDVLAFMSEMMQQFEGPGMEDEMDAEPAEPAGAPRF
ncbi:MAG: hypothetical protein AB7Q00_09945 [Phycisphaerales bacterium]